VTSCPPAPAAAPSDSGAEDHLPARGVRLLCVIFPRAPTSPHLAHRGIVEIEQLRAAAVLTVRWRRGCRRGKRQPALAPGLGREERSDWEVLSPGLISATFSRSRRDVLLLPLVAAMSCLAVPDASTRSAHAL
jgi:hypothetical protein